MRYTKPSKKINSAQDLEVFRSTLAYKHIKDTLIGLTRAVSLKECPTSTDNYSASKLVEILERLDKLIDQTPPLTGPRRFGNISFRTWHDRLNSDVERLLREAWKTGETGEAGEVGEAGEAGPTGDAVEIGDSEKSEDVERLQESKPFTSLKSSSKLLSNAISSPSSDPWTELIPYFLGSFGSRQRLDFGTGHELSFLAFIGGLLTLQILSHVSGEDLLLIFETYFNVIRKLIITYTLEPAGSHGVWGLDDHFHLPYILGSAQLVDFTITHDVESLDLPPRSVLDRHRVAEHKKQNLYFSAIAFVIQVKNGPFHEHSPMLYDISYVGTWGKIHRGMMKMYYAEVLGKFPVVQHFLFGTGFYPWTDLNGNELPSSSEDPLEDLIAGSTKAPWA